MIPFITAPNCSALNEHSKTINLGYSISLFFPSLSPIFDPNHAVGATFDSCSTYSGRYSPPSNGSPTPSYGDNSFSCDLHLA